MIGQVVNYRYEILEKCGDGSFFAVYKARDKVLNRLVAVKILQPQYAANKDFAERVIAEAQAVSELAHPNTAKIFEADRQDGLYFIATEYIRGVTLKDRIRRLAPFSATQTIDITIAIGEALESAHRHSIVHGDLRPQNVIVASDSQVKLTDFGMAAAVSSFPSIQTNTVLRSVHYMSPEVAEGKIPRPASDIYSLGITLYEMLTGTAPFDGDTAIAVALRHAKDPPPSPRVLNAGVPKSLEAIVLKALQKLPDDRYRNMQEMLQALRDARQQLTTTQQAAYGQTFDEPITQAEAVDLAVEEQEPKGFLSGALKLAFFLFVMAVVLLVGMIGIFLYGNKREVETPLLVGKSQTEAESITGGLGLGLTVVGEEYNDKYTVGQVYMALPEAGMKIKGGQNIKIWVSKGSRFIRAPDVVDLSEERARIKIVDAGLDIGESVQVHSDTVPAGSIVKQSPEPGTQLERGQPMKLFVSMGKEPDTSITTPPDTENTEPQTETTSGERTFDVKLKVPSDGPSIQNVRIDVIDDYGEATAYQADHSAGDIVIQSVKGTGARVTIRVYIDGVKKKELVE
ncbi:MAG: protein kinase [Armatimonadota bacterium]|nr:protein kinase [Armatimonadota bacterium]